MIPSGLLPAALLIAEETTITNKFLVSIFLLFVLSTPALGQVDLENVGAGDVIDNNTAIPDGAVINLNGGSIASGTVFSAADFPNGTTLNINDGVVGLGVVINNSTINIAGGQVALGASNLSEGVNNFSNSVTITGGDVGGFFQLRGNSTLELSNGTIESFGTLPSASATVTGGAFTLVDNNGALSISGGDFNTFRSFGNSTVNLFGTDFAIDGQPITNLALGEAFEITQRNVTLTGTLSDGSTFSNFLDSSTPIRDLDFGPFATFADLEAVPGFAASGATINVTLVRGVTPTPLLGDCNLDGDVNFSDISPFIAILSGDGFLTEADINEDGVVDFCDISPFISILAL